MLAQIKSLCFVLAMLLLLTIPSKTQDETQPVLVDELNGDNCEMLLSSLDQFVAVLATQNSKGFVLFNTTTDTIRDNFLYRFLQLHKSTRSGDRYEIIPTTRPGASLFQMWNGSPGTDWAKSSMSYKLDLGENRKVFFASELIEPFKVEGKLTFSEVGAGCSTRWLDLGLLSLLLDRNPGAKAYFIVRGTLRRSDQLKRFLVAQSGEPIAPSDKSRKRFLYAGSRMRNNKQFVEVEIFISLLETKSAKAFPYNLGIY